MRISQEVFNFQFPTTFGEDNFFVSEANQEAVSYLSARPWGHGAVCVLYGPEGSGKTHLATIFARQVGAVKIALDDLMHKRINLLESSSFFVIEDLDHHLTPSVEEALFHFYNEVNSRVHPVGVLLTASKPVDQWGIQLKDLHSRLRSSYAVPIHAPDQDLLMAVLMKDLSDQQLQISPQVANYIATHAERSFVYIHKLTRTIDKESLSRHRKITVPLIKELMSGL